MEQIENGESKGFDHPYVDDDGGDDDDDDW